MLAFLEVIKSKGEIKPYLKRFIDTGCVPFISHCVKKEEHVNNEGDYYETKKFMWSLQAKIA